MKISTKLFVFAISLAGLTTSVNAQSTATAITTATLITPISIEWASDMDFGTIASSGIEGTVTLANDGTVTVGGGVSVPEAGITTTAASFIVKGEGTSTFSITHPSTIDLTNGESTLTVTGITAAQGIAGTLVLGTSTINVGGILTVPAGTLAGTYANPSGLFVTVNYN